MTFYSGPTLEEISIGKQIRTKLEKCTYEQLYNIATYIPKEYKYHRNPFHPLNIIHSILSPSASGREAAKEYNAASRPKEDKPKELTILGSFKALFSMRNVGREAAKEYKVRRMRNLAREVIAEKYSDCKQPTQLEDYL